MFSIKKSLKFGWDTFKANWALLLGASLIMIVIGFIPQLFGGRNGALLFGFLITIVALVLRFIMQIGYTKIIFKLHDGEKAEIGDLFKYYTLFWHYIWTIILVGLIIVLPTMIAMMIVAAIGLVLTTFAKGAGLFLAIILGIAVAGVALYFSVRLAFAHMEVVDKDNWGTDALKKSWDMTRNEAMHLFKLTLVLIALNIFGLIAFFVGIFVTAPITLLTMVYVYRKLSGHKHHEKHTEETTPSEPVSEAVIEA